MVYLLNNTPHVVGQSKRIHFLAFPSATFKVHFAPKSSCPWTSETKDWNTAWPEPFLIQQSLFNRSLQENDREDPRIKEPWSIPSSSSTSVNYQIQWPCDGTIKFDNLWQNPQTIWSPETSRPTIFWTYVLDSVTFSTQFSNSGISYMKPQLYQPFKRALYFTSLEIQPADFTIFERNLETKLFKITFLVWFEPKDTFKTLEPSYHIVNTQGSERAGPTDKLSTESLIYYYFSFFASHLLILGSSRSATFPLITVYRLIVNYLHCKDILQSVICFSLKLKAQSSLWFGICKATTFG